MNKSHGHTISIRMLNFYSDSICPPLEIIFKTPLRNGRFSLEKKNVNVIPIPKKRRYMNYQKLLYFHFYLFVGKHLNIFFITLCLYNTFSKNDVLSSNHSGFRLGDSCIKQPLSINCQIFSAFDMRLEVRRIFLDISKTFGKVWHARIIFIAVLKWRFW